MGDKLLMGYADYSIHELSSFIYLQHYLNKSNTENETDNASIGCNPSTTMANFVRAVNEMSKIYILDGGEITYLEDVLLILQRLLYLLPDAFEHLKKLEIELKLQAVFVWCLKNKFDIAEAVARRLWSDCPANLLHLKQRVDTVIRAQNLDNTNAELLSKLNCMTYEDFLTLCKVVISECYNHLPQPFILKVNQHLLEMNKVERENDVELPFYSGIKLSVKQMSEIRKKLGASKSGLNEQQRREYNEKLTVIRKNASYYTRCIPHFFGDLMQQRLLQSEDKMAALNDMWNKDWRNAKSMAKLRKLLKVESIQTPDGSVLEKAVEELENHTCCSKVASVIPDISESTAVNSSSTLPRENQDSPYNLRLFEQHQRPRNRNLSYALRIPVRQQSSIGQSLLQNDGKHDAEKNDDDDKDVVEVDGNSSESDGDSDEPSVKESTADEDDRRSIVSKKRRKWMDEEVADLYHGMQRYGSVAMNRWATIRADTSLRYLRGRSNVDLKDKWRWIEKRPKLLQKLANQYGKL